MAKREFTFNTKAEAKAFVRGVEFVNDSSVRVVQIFKEKGKWFVEVADDDYTG